MNVNGFNVRYAIVAIMAFVGFWLFRMGTSSDLDAGAQILALVIGLVLFVAAAVALARGERGATDGEVELREPAFSRFLFHSPRSAPLWLGARLYLGYEWLDAGRHKLTEDAWMQGGAALRGYWERAVSIPEKGQPPISYGPYREYIQYMLDHEWYTWFAKVIVFGELLIGIGLIVGALVGVAAFFGALMNMSFMLAGSASTNPVLFALSIALILAWRVAGLIGLDRFLLPALGAPWSPGMLVRGSQRRPEQVART